MLPGTLGRCWDPRRNDTLPNRGKKINRLLITSCHHMQPPVFFPLYILTIVPHCPPTAAQVSPPQLLYLYILEVFSAGSWAATHTELCSEGQDRAKGRQVLEQPR